MNWWIYLIGFGVLALLLFVVTYILDKITYFDINVDGKLIRGCRCNFHDWQGYLEIENPETGRVIIHRFQYYSVEKVYFKRLRKEDPNDDV